ERGGALDPEHLDAFLLDALDLEGAELHALDQPLHILADRPQLAARRPDRGTGGPLPPPFPRCFLPVAAPPAPAPPPPLPPPPAPPAAVAPFRRAPVASLATLAAAARLLAPSARLAAPVPALAARLARLRHDQRSACEPRGIGHFAQHEGVRVEREIAHRLRGG